MTFARPELLALVPIVVLLLTLGLTAQWRRHRKLADAFGGAAAARRLTSRDLYSFPRRRLVCLIGAGVVMSLALAAARPVHPLILLRPIASAGHALQRLCWRLQSALG